MSEPLDDLDASVRAALSETEHSITDLDEVVERWRRETGEDWQANYLPLDVMAEEVALDDDELRWPNGEPVRIFTYWPSEQD